MLVLLSTGSAHGNDDQNAQTDPNDSQFAWLVSAEGSLSTGNVRRSLLTARSEAAWTGDLLGVAFEPSFVYGEQSGSVREREIRGRTFVYLYPRERWFAFALGVVESSRQRRLDLRDQIGVGVGRRLVHTARHRFRGTVAVLHERSRFDDLAARDDWRITLRVKGMHEHGSLRLREEAWWQPALDGSHTSRARLVMNLDATIAGPVAFRVGLEDNYDQTAAVGLHRHDFRLTFGFAFSRGTFP